MRNMTPRIYFRNTRTVARDSAPRYNSRRIARDASQTPTTNQANLLPSANPFTSFGWVASALGDMGNTARWASSLNPDNNCIVAGLASSNSPLESLATTPAAMLNAALIACAGSGVKTYSSATWPSQSTATPVTLALSATGQNVFGAYVRISNALTTFKFGAYEIQLWNGTPSASSATPSSIVVEVVSLPVEIIILSVSNAAGKGTVVGNSAPNIYFPSSATGGAIGNLNYGAFAVGDLLYAESLNMRDIGNVVSATQSGAITI